MQKRPEMSINQDSPVTWPGQERSLARKIATKVHGLQQAGFSIKEKIAQIQTDFTDARARNPRHPFREFLSNQFFNGLDDTP
jgi:hypothetical protein